MHIPKGATQEISLLTFAQAREHREESASYDRERWLYIPDFYSEYRYILGTAGCHPLITIGVNPSTAEPDNLDPTLKSVERIALYNGFDSFIMFNVYAQRATRPDDMDAELNEALHAENMNAFRWALARGEGVPAVWAAWGAVIEKRGYLRRCVRDMVTEGEHCGAQWYLAGKRTKAGHPHHPLYLRKNTPVEPFDVRTYLETL